MSSPPAAATVPIRLELTPALLATLGGDDEATLKGRVEHDVAELLSQLGLVGAPAVEVVAGPPARPLRVVVHGSTVPYPMRVLLSARPDFTPDPELRSGATSFTRSPAAWTSLVRARLEAPRPTEWAVEFARWLALAAIRLAPSCLVTDAQATAYLGQEPAAVDGARAAFTRRVLTGLLDLGVGLRARDVVLGAVEAGAAVGSTPAQVVEQAFRRLRGYEVSLIAHPEYLGELVGSPLERPIGSGQLEDAAVGQQFDYVGQAVRRDLGLAPPRVRLVPDPSMPVGWMVVQLHDQRGWSVRGLRPGNLLVLESARRADQRGLETRAMQNPYTGEEGTEVPAAAAPDLDLAGVPYWSAGAFAAVVTHLALRRRVETLIGPAEVESLLAELAQEDPDLVRLAVQLCTITELTGVLRALVREGIPIRDLRTILGHLVREDIGTVVETDDTRLPDDGAAGTRHLTSRVRRGLRAGLGAQHAGPHRRLLALRASAEFEWRAGLALTAREQTREQLLDELWEAVEQTSRAGALPLLVTSDGARWPVRDLVDAELPELPVLAESELRGDIEVVSLPWKEETMAVDYLVVCDRVARLLTESVGPSLETDGPGSFSFSRGSAAVTVEAARRDDLHTVITVSARPATELPAAPETFERFSTQGPEPGVQVLLERHGATLRPVCSMVMLGDFLDPEELEFAVATVTAAADRL